MSDGVFLPGYMVDIPQFDRMVADSSFAPDHRYHHDRRQNEPACKPQAEPCALDDAVAKAYAAGVERGRSDAIAEAKSVRHHHASLALSFERLDETMIGDLSQRLRETVAILCSSVMGKIATDGNEIMQRCDAAARLLATAGQPTVLRLHPEDIASLSPDFTAEHTILGDPTMERGNLLAENADGGLSCGPQEWDRRLRAAIGL
ncbi:FliH/SctL family protein [Croceicoccus sp. F390]|uniref:FliH/SctL family protein n=1 Tax=Croceicoccus esteveae TaxID=3075597 RepID=A0ABU2ZDL0_9SPHN|nr:FliH/SctL family protein [Croceicoccus sp. F390]MDT0574689.1 FliH/SctL family protein [Croceicoccus sp. F390]